MICFTATLTGFLKKIYKCHGAVFSVPESGRRKAAAESRFAKPRKTFQRKVSKFFALLFVLYKKQEKAAKPQKDLILFARICCFGALIRGLQNLGTPCEGDIFTFFLRRAKRTKKHARGLRTSGLRGRFKALSKKIQQSFPAARVETGFARKTPA